jgi:tRNA (cytidine/uridine-2'-O-)-methyltransferase
MDDKQLRRAGLDYHEYASVKVHRDFAALLQAERPAPARMFAFTTAGTRLLGDVIFAPGDWLVFGAETSGLPDQVRAEFPPAQRIRLPLRPGNRSLNLSNAVAVVVYEAWRQQGYAGGL